MFWIGLMIGFLIGDIATLFTVALYTAINGSDNNENH